VSVEGVPLADRLAVRVPVVVIGPPVDVVNVKKSELAVDIEVTVPIPSEASIVFTISLTLKFLVTFSVLKSDAIK
tara:strand:- start:322 stop:546 length:225 start_codon:yes stop_codon:yes gene_type:complete